MQYATVDTISSSTTDVLGDPGMPTQLMATFEMLGKVASHAANTFNLADEVFSYCLHYHYYLISEYINTYFDIFHALFCHINGFS